MKILLIDDDKKLADLVVKFMRAEGFATMSAFNDINTYASYPK